MAGIGFELRKLFLEKDRAFGDIKALAYSSIVSVGPWIITSISLNIIIWLSKIVKMSREEKIVYTSTILYAFIFSQLLTGPFQYLITRYVSDCIFSNKIYKIRGAYLGIVKIITILAFFMSYFFIRKANFSGNYKAVFVTLFVTMSLSWITMIFISLLKNYNFMIKSFFIGNIISIFSAYIFLKYKVSFFNENFIFWLLFSYMLGMFFNFTLTSLYLLKIFKGENKGDFEFLIYFKGYFTLFLIGFFYVSGVWSHIIINWFIGKDSYIIKNIFLVSPFYETAVFYAFCTSIPSMVYFMIFLETRFISVYKEYYKKIFYIGTYDEINSSLSKMYEVLNKEILYCMELQFIISLSFVFTSNIIFDYFRLDLYLLDIFRLTILSSYCAVFISIFITIFLYFDSRLYALYTAFIFFISSVIFSYIFGKMGEDYVGVGFFISSFITFGIANFFAKQVFKDLNYITMFKRNFEVELNSNILRKLDKILEKKIYIILIFVFLFLLSGCSKYDRKGFNNITKRNWHTMSVYSLEGYDYYGYNSEGIDKRGFDRAGWNVFTDTAFDYYGFNIKKINKDTGKKYDERGFDYKQYNLFTNSLYDRRGFDYVGINKETKTEYDKSGWNYYGVNKYTGTYYDKEGYNYEGYDKNGYTRYNKNMNMEEIIFNEKFQEIKILWVDEDGFNQDGIYVGGNN